MGSITGKLMRIYHDTQKTVRIEKHFLNFLDHYAGDMESEYVLTREQKKDYVDYYRSFGFGHVSTKWLEFYYGMTGVYDRKLIPDDLFSLYIDPIYPEIRDHYQNKAYQPRLMPGVTFPHTIVKKTSGYYMDENDVIIDEKRALEIIGQYDRVVIKPSVYSGGGTEVNFYASHEVTQEVLGKYHNECYGDELVIQELIRQSDRMTSFNPGAVNTDKILSFLFHGKVYILAAHLRIAGPGMEKDNATSKDNILVGIRDDGRLMNEGLKGLTEKVSSSCTGIKFEGQKLEFHRECLNIIRRAHPYMPKFPIISWDFAQDISGKLILIEYNLKWHSLMPYQLTGGPVFGDLTDEALGEAAMRRKDNKSLIYR